MTVAFWAVSVDIDQPRIVLGSSGAWKALACEGRALGEAACRRGSSASEGSDRDAEKAPLLVRAR
jgi:hypothetical protein